MPAELNFFDTYTLMAVYKRVVPKKTFFRDRYFPTSDEDIFASNKVLTEYMDGDQKMAAFVAPRVGAIPMERMGYEIHELEPAFIGMSRELSTDDLTKRGFGEAIYANSTPAQRAAKLTQKDLADMDARIVRREEWMCAQTMLDNGCTMQEMIDNQTKGDTKVVKFYNPGHENDHIYVPAAKWNEEGGKFFEDVAAMCDIPYESPSNKTVHIDGLCDDDGNTINLTYNQALVVDAAGICTFLNFMGGWTAWGNHTACYPKSTDVKDYFIPLSRMFDYVTNTLIKTFWSKLDKPMNRRLIDTILDSATIWLNGLVGAGYLLGARVEMLENENPLTSLMAGKIKLHIYMTPPSPAQEIDFVLEYDADYVTSALQS